MTWDEIVRRVRVMLAHASLARPLGKRNNLAPYLASVARLRRVLDPAGSARRDGKNNLPDLRSQNRGAWEHGAITNFQDQLERMKKEVGTLVRDCDTRIKRLPAAPVLNVVQLRSEVEANLTGLKERAKLPLIDTTRAMRRARRNYVAFQDENDLAREPSIPIRILTGLWIVAVFLCEVFLNYLMLWRQGGGSAQSVLGVVLVPAFIGASLGLATGLLGVRHLFHRRPKNKIIGLCVVIVGGLLIFGLHTMMADYRVALSQVGHAQLPDDQKAEQLAAAYSGIWKNAWANPGAFTADFSAVLYFLTGMTFSAAAVLEGVFLVRDRYPGYLSSYNEYQKAHARDLQERSAFERAVAAVFKRGEERAYATRAVGRGRVAAIKAIRDEARSYVRHYEAAATKVHQALIQLIGEYRSTNRKIRDGAAPDYFTTDVPLLNKELPFTLDNMAQAEEVTNNNQASLEVEVEKFITSLTKSEADYKNAVRVFLDEIEKNARAADVAEAQAFGVREARL